MDLLSFDSIDDRPENEEPYDETARWIGRGLPSKAGVYLLPYLQSGHFLLVLVLLLCSSIYYPGTHRIPRPPHPAGRVPLPMRTCAGFPLTTVPEEYRNLMREGLVSPPRSHE